MLPESIMENEGGKVSLEIQGRSGLTLTEEKKSKPIGD